MVLPTKHEDIYRVPLDVVMNTEKVSHGELYFLSTSYNHFMTMLEYWVGSL